MNSISQKADVHKKAILGKNIVVDPFTVIEENVKIGDNTKIGPCVYISGRTDIGKNNMIHHGASIGDWPQDTAYKGDKSFVCIGDNNSIREFVSIHRGTKPKSKTIIGSNNMFMVYSHVGHNCIVKDNIIIVNSSSLGGYVEVDNNVFFSAASEVHQFCKIGKYVMVAPLTKVGKDAPPYMLVIGADTAVVRSLNVVGLRRADISSSDREIIKQAYKILYHKGLSVTSAVEEIKKAPVLNDNAYIIELLDFIHNSSRGICGHYRK